MQSERFETIRKNSKLNLQVKSQVKISCSRESRKSTSFVIDNFISFFFQKKLIKNGIIFFRVDHKPLITWNVHALPYFSFHSKILVVRGFETNLTIEKKENSMEFNAESFWDKRKYTHSFHYLSFFSPPREIDSNLASSHFTIDSHFRSE